VYHVELRKFPHNFCRFNLTEQELRATILDAWTQGHWVELGERRWNPHEATLRVLEGPRLAVAELSMGRGWRAATRRGRDVTDQLLSRAAADTLSRAADTPRMGEGGSAGPTPAATPVPLDPRPTADSLALEIAAKLTLAPQPIALAWELAQKRHPELSASACLDLAERAIRTLLQAGLVVVLAPHPRGEPSPCTSPAQVTHALRGVRSWSRPSDPGDPHAVLLRRA
jgi:hypothetical protein